MTWTTGTDTNKVARRMLYRDGRPVAITVEGYPPAIEDEVAVMKEIARRLNAFDALVTAASVLVDEHTFGDKGPPLESSIEALRHALTLARI